MTSVDINIPEGTGWLGIVPQGTFMFLHNNSNHSISYRFGINSLSNGLTLGRGDYIKVEETVYVRYSPHHDFKLVVIGD